MITARYTRKKQRRPSRKAVLTLTLLFVVAAGVVAILELSDTTYLFHDRPRAQSDGVVTAGTPVEPPKSSTSNTATDQPAVNTGEKSMNSGSTGGGGATDTKGSAQVGSGAGVSSQTGNVTVKSPVANATLRDGASLSGTAKVTAVQFRLIDNTVGVLAQGELSVVNGNFSGDLHFQPKGTGGRLDVFSLNEQGVETNEVQINVAF